MPRGPGVIQQKILLLLLGGLTLGLSRSPTRYFKILTLIGKEWRNIEREALWRSIRGLYKSKLIGTIHQTDGSVTLTLSEKGKRYAMTYQLDEMKIQKPNHWDGKWRLIAFDIPEKRKRIRDALRFRFLQIGLFEFQKSIFITPYPCENEIDFLIEFHYARPYVRKILAEHIDNQLYFEHKFGLSKP